MLASLDSFFSVCVYLVWIFSELKQPKRIKTEASTTLEEMICVLDLAIVVKCKSDHWSRGMGGKAKRN